MPARHPRSDEVNAMILDFYHEHGPKPIAEKFGLSESTIGQRARKLGIRTALWRHGSGTKDPRRSEIDQMIREVYPIYGPEPIMEKFGLNKNVVQIHAGLLGVKIDTTLKNQRRADFLDEVQRSYPEHGPRPIAEKFGVSIEHVYFTARSLGVKINSVGQYERASQTRVDLFDTLDLSLWTPNLTKVGAYYLGLAWADATTWYKTPDIAKDRKSHYFVRFCQSGEEDRCVVDYLARALGLPPERVKPVKRYKDFHKIPYGLKLSGKRIASLFIEHFRIPMRKSYTDPRYPNIPDEMLGAFSCGLFDGDGCKALYTPNSPNPHYRFYGSESFLRTFRQKLEDQVGVRFRPVRPHTKKGSLWVFGVYDIRQTVPLTRFLYNSYYREEGVPYLTRKREPFQCFLTPGWFTIRGGYKRFM